MTRPTVNGRVWPSEMRDYRDDKTGRRVRQLTTSGNNVHLYFTENAFVQGENAVIFRSDRASGEARAPHESPHYQIFRLELATGLITQLTDEPRSVGRTTKTPDGSLVVFSSGDAVRALEPESGKLETLYEETGPFSLGAPSIAPGGRYVAFTRNERVDFPHGPNYSGFAERYYGTKDGRVTVAYFDGTPPHDLFRDTCQLAHVQFCPTDPTLAMFCHEGPWHLVTQRVWLLDLVSRTVRPCVRQGPDDSVGHEFWTAAGEVFFDNRGPGHDGTITSAKTQAVATAAVPTDFVPYVGLADRRGEILWRLELPYYCNHYHADPGARRLVGDAVDDLVLIDLSGERATPETLCTHGTSWHTQASHAHPTWDWDGNRILFASDRGGKVNLYLVEV